MSSILKIAYIIPSLDSKAPIFVAKRLADYFVNKGYEVKVFYFDEIVKVSFPCEVQRITITDPIDFDYYDIVHSHMMRPDKYVASFSNIIKKAKTVSTIHCNIKDDLTYSYGHIVANIFTRKWINWLKKFDRTVQINDYLLSLYSHKLKNNSLIYNGISLSYQKDDYSDIIQNIMNFKRKNLNVICSYSGIVKRKGLMQVLKLLIKRNDLAYICIGEGKQKEKLVKYTIKNHISDRVYFSPFKKNPYYVMEYADLFVIPSYSEGFSLALLEAGSIGASVICSNIPAFTLPFSEKEVTSFEIDKIISFSRAVDVAITEKNKKSSNLKKKINECFSEEKMFQSYLDLYETLIKE